MNPHVVGPPTVEEGFISSFMHHAYDGEDDFRVGDEFRVSALGVEVRHGRILSAVVVSTSGAADEEESYPVVRLRARISIKENSYVPPGFVLVKGVHSWEANVQEASTEWRPVRAVVDTSAKDLKTHRTVLLDVVLDEYGNSAEHCECNAEGAKVNRGVYLFTEDLRYEVEACPSLDAVWNRFQNSLDPVEGVVVTDDAISEALNTTIMEGVDKLIARQAVPDYHPNTNNVVLDVVHPSLYPFVSGVTKVRGEASPSSLPEVGSDGHPRTDRWGRMYEESKFQWLPAIYNISEEGKCKIASYINNLPMETNEALVGALEELFEAFLPSFEVCYSYLREIRFVEGDDDDLSDIERRYSTDLAASRLRGRELRVVTKIVEYQLGVDDSFDGVWHVEGMSHESIVMTGLYILNREDDFEGGDLLFKRAFLDYEASAVFEEIPQCRHPSTEKIVDEGLVPLGTVKTPRGRMIVFPNSHVHKLSKMFLAENANVESGTKKTRRIVVFWVVDPEREDMVTTREVYPPQQISMSREDAFRYRLELMEERKRFKQDWNVRTIELCEH